MGGRTANLRDKLNKEAESPHKKHCSAPLASVPVKKEHCISFLEFQSGFLHVSSGQLVAFSKRPLRVLKAHCQSNRIYQIRHQT